LSDWFNGTSIPSKAKEREFRFLVEFLEGRAVQRSVGYVRRGADGWKRLCENARPARRNRDGTARPGARSGAGVVAGSDYL